MYNLVKYLSEYAALRIMAGILNAMPYRAALSAGLINAWIGFYIFRFRTREAKKRIRCVFGNHYTDKDIQRIAWQSWCNIVFNAIETMRLPQITLTSSRIMCDCDEYLATIKNHCKTGKGGIIATPHMGSWELAGVISNLNDIPVFAVAAQQKNLLVDHYLNNLRARARLETVIRGSGTMKQIMKKLNTGNILAILPDVRMRTKGVQVPFLGGQANLGPGMASFAKHADVPIFPVVNKRLGQCRHKMMIFEPIWPDNNLDKEEDVFRMTRHVMNIFEKEIRLDPGQWFWFNKRWVLDPFTDEQQKNDSISEGSIQ